MKEGEYYDATNRRRMVVLPGKRCRITQENGDSEEYDMAKILFLGGQWEKIEVSKLDNLIDRLKGR